MVQQLRRLHAREVQSSQSTMQRAATRQIQRRSAGKSQKWKAPTLWQGHRQLGQADHCRCRDFVDKAYNSVSAFDVAVAAAAL